MKSLAVGVMTVALLASGCTGGADPDVSAPVDSKTASGAPGSPGAPDADPRPEPPVPVVAPLVWASCEAGFECSTLRVPLVEEDPSKGTVDLALTRKVAPDPARRLGSLVINPGGPGASAVGYLQDAWEQIPKEVRARFDLVAFDPRGVGRSAPVRCGTTKELDGYFAVDPSPDTPAEMSALTRANSQFAQECQRRSGATLPYVSTADAARDLDKVREGLGDQKLTYLGYSYGTALGAEYLDRFPKRVRAMVLDGGIDPTLSWDRLLEGQSRGFDQALEAFLANCERINCAFRRVATGPLGAAYDALAARIEKTPLPGDGKRTLGPAEFSLGVGAGLYSKENGWPAISAGLAAAVEQGKGRILLSLSDLYLSRTDEGYENTNEANLAVNCLDRPWPREDAPYLALAEKVRPDAPRFGPAIALAGLACARWPVEPVGEPSAVAAPGAPPILVIGTTGDPATPFAWSEALADQLSSGVLLTHEGDGHTVYREGAPDCVLDAANRYLLTGDAPKPLTC